MPDITPQFIRHAFSVFAAAWIPTANTEQRLEAARAFYAGAQEIVKLLEKPGLPIATATSTTITITAEEGAALKAIEEKFEQVSDALDEGLRR